MADQAVTTSAPPASTEPKSPRSIASSISESIQKKANGVAPVANPPITDKQPATTQSDPNVGKEKYVVDGKEVWLTPKEREGWIQKGMSFEPRVEELNRLRQETNKFLQTLSSDPLKILTDKRIGMTPELVLEKIFASGHISEQMKEAAGKWYYDNVVEPSKLSPQELEARENKKKLTTFEQREKARADAVIQQENLARVNRAMGQLKANISEAMKDSGLPNNDSPLGAEMARMVADTMRVAQRQNQNITPKQAIEYVKQRIRSVQVAYYDHLDGDSLVKELGEANAEKVKQYFLKLAGNGNKPPVVPSGTPRASRNGERKTISQDDFRDYLDDLKRKG